MASGIGGNYWNRFWKLIYQTKDRLSRLLKDEGLSISLDKVNKGNEIPKEEDRKMNADSEITVKRFLEIKLQNLLSKSGRKLNFPTFDSISVSIVVPTYNKASLLYQLLESILANTSKDIPFEVVIVDDHSSDETTDLLGRVENAVKIRNKENLDFIKSCNKGADAAAGDRLLFLNDDVVVTPGWLSGLTQALSSYRDAGAVGPKIVRWDGSLQEAGSIVWQSGVASGYGREDDPNKPEYNYLREVDYVSGACLLVKRELFDEIGGFDERYLPAYYEDTDLCFELADRGYSVVYQPEVTILHSEYGSRSEDEVREQCQTNVKIFAQKWKEVLAGKAKIDRFLSARDNREGERLLVLDDQIPVPHMGRGYPRANRMLNYLADLGFVITFLPLIDRRAFQPTLSRLQQKGIEVFYGGEYNVQDLLISRSGYYDKVLLSRPHNADNYMKMVRRLYSNATLYYDAEALFSIRKFMRQELRGKEVDEEEKKEQLNEELSLMSFADEVITVSERERNVVKENSSIDSVHVWGHTHEIIEPETDFENRDGMLFVGSFGAGHPPNVDAVKYFANDLFPAIKKTTNDSHFYIVGTDPPEEVQELASDEVTVTGYVEDLREYYEKCRVFVVPLRFGAGINYKLTEAMSYGIPSVVTKVAAMGLDVRDGDELMIANGDDEFVEKTVKLYENKDLWGKVQESTLRFIENQCSPKAMKKKAEEIFLAG